MDFTCTIDYHGSWLSLNTLLGMNRWQRTKLLVGLKEEYKRLLEEAQVPALATFQVTMRYWSRLDADNVLMKYFIDTMRAQGIVVNDDKRYFGGVHAVPDAGLKHNHNRILIEGTRASSPIPAPVVRAKNNPPNSLKIKPKLRKSLGSGK